MFDDLHEALVNSHKAVQWFALGEAVRLAATIEKICIHYSEKKDDENFRKALVGIANRTADFLKRHSSKDGIVAIANLQTALITIEMEG